LGAVSEEEAIARLTRIRGIGRWTAEYALMRGYGARDALPAADIGLRNAVTRVYGLDHQATEAEVRTLAQAWAGWRSYGAFYLWATLWPPTEASDALES
jgi:DNA-3-methyladenine glycosylase II